MSLYRRKDSPYYWSKLFVGGEPVSFSTRERTKVAALRVERDQAAKLSERQRIGGKYTLATMAAKFVAWKEADGRAPETVAKIEEHLGAHILPFFGKDRDVRDLDDAAVEEFKAARMARVGAVTVGKQLSTVRQLLKYCRDVQRVLERVPNVKNPRHRYEPKYRLLTDAELSAFLDALATLRSREALPYLLLLVNTGMRPGEALRLTWEMVDAQARKIVLPAAATKNRRGRTVDLNAGAETALAALRGLNVGKVFGQRDHRTAIKMAIAASGIGGKLRPHDLRHTLASRLHREGVEPVVIRDTLGHITWSMVNHYAHAFADQRRKAIDSVAVGVALRGPERSITATNGPPRKVLE